MTLLYTFISVIVSLLTVVSGEIPTFSYEQRLLRHNHKNNRSQPFVDYGKTLHRSIRRLGTHPHYVDPLLVTTRRFERTFFARTIRMWNELPATVFPLDYDMGLFKRPKPFLRSHTAHAYPEPLPTAPRRMPPMDPYHKFRQGYRRRGDMRVYNQKFDYEPQDSGQRMTCSAITNCYITHLTVETDGAVPMLVQGGFGYTFFLVMIHGKPADRLSGRLRAYCMKPKDDPAIRSNRPMKMAFDTDSADTSDDD